MRKRKGKERKGKKVNRFFQQEIIDKKEGNKSFVVDLVCGEK